jgi:DHA1 family inner membrane transport protein
MTTVEQSYGGRLYPRLAVLALGLFVVATNAFVIAGLLPNIATTFGVHPSDVSYSITWYAVIVAVAAPAISILLPRVSRTTLMALGLVLVAIGTVVAAASPTLLVFTLGRVIAALGGAALVPAATAAAAALAPVERRGRAIAFVAVGFTAATAFGAPLGTAVASAGGWRVPLFALAVLAALTAAAVALFVRGVPLAAPVSVRRRFGVLRDSRVLLALAATLLVIGGFNVVYIFSSAVLAPATHGDGSVLALLLLVFGLSGVAGNAIAGPLTDRIGSRRSAIVFLGGQIIVLALVPLAVNSFAAIAVLFVVWGIAANGASLPIQHRLIAIDPATAGVALSWYSTAMYAGIALAPLLGSAVIGLGAPELVPVLGAVVTALALLAFLLGWVRRTSAEPIAA